MCSILATEGYAVNLIVADGLGDETNNGVSIIDVGAKSGGRLSRMTTIDRNSLFERRGRAPDNSTAKRRFHAFSLIPQWPSPHSWPLHHGTRIHEIEARSYSSAI